jgi:hypothetical protein
MRIVDPGHKYILDELDKDDGDLIYLTFVKRLGDKYPGNTGHSHGGTYCQDVLRALIDRCKYLNNQISCPQTIRIIKLLRNALYLFEHRAAELKGELPSFFSIEEIRSDLVNIEAILPCKSCGHLYPHEHLEPK